jgi:hypothetical protein
MIPKSVTLVLLATLTSACVAWQPAPMNGPGITPEDVTSRVRITRTDSTTVVLTEAMLRSDSITGYEESGARRSVAISDVQMLEARRPSPAVVLLPALVVAAIVIPRVFSRSLRDSSGDIVVE